MDSELMKYAPAYRAEKCKIARKSRPAEKETIPLEALDQTWRDSCRTTSEMLAKARHKALFVDVHFLVGQEGLNVRHFSAHKLILACGSPFFEAMFFGPLAEKKDPIPMIDDDPQAFHVMLRYLYGEKNCFPSILVACKAYYLADKYLIPQLQKISADFIAHGNMDDASFWGIIEDNLFCCKNAEEKFKDYLQVHASRLLKDNQFLDIPKEIVEMILQMDRMYITELELLICVSRWSQKNGVSRWDLQGLLQNIRFSTLTSQEFCRFHESFSDVLDSETCLKILKHLSDPNNCRPPDWCSGNKTRRHMKKNVPVC